MTSGKQIEILCEYIQNGDTENARELINAMDDVNAKTSPLDNMIHMITQGEVSVTPPICVASKKGNLEIMKLLLEKGADPNQVTQDCATALEMYCRQGYRSGVEGLVLLIEAGADPKTYTLMPPAFALMDNYYTYPGNRDDFSDNERQCIEEELFYLIDQGVSWLNDDEKAPDYLMNFLHLAATADRPDFLEKLLVMMPDEVSVNQIAETGWTPLMYAAFNGCAENYRLLMRFGADPKIENSQGKTAEQYAEEKGI